MSSRASATPLHEVPREPTSNTTAWPALPAGCAPPNIAWAGDAKINKAARTQGIELIKPVSVDLSIFVSLFCRRAHRLHNPTISHMASLGRHSKANSTSQSWILLGKHRGVYHTNCRLEPAGTR